MAAGARSLPPGAVADLDFLRGAAALVVVLSHVVPAIVADRRDAPSSSLFVHRAVGAFGGLGHSSVLLFFVLSGYLVARSVFRGPPDRRWRVYLAARTSRILTVYWPALVVGAGIDALGMRLLGTVGIYAGVHPANGFAMVRPAETLTPSIFLGNALFAQWIRTWILGSNAPLWSLSYEVWFYVAFPFVLVVLERRSLARVSGALLALGAMAVWVRLTAASNFVFWLLGAGIAWKEPTLSLRFGSAARTMAVLAVVAATLVRSRITGWWLQDAVVVLAHAALLVTIVCRDDAPRPGWFARWSARSAAISFSLYLVHVPVVVLLVTALRIPPRRPASTESLLWVLLVTVACVAWALGMYLLVERHTPRMRALFEKGLGVQRDGSRMA